jgi:predicted nucleic acid-binding protein
VTTVDRLYADASALAKLFVREPESAALAAALPAGSTVVTSAIARIEVTRVLRISSLDDDVEQSTDDVFAGCILVDVDEEIVRSAARLTSFGLKTLDSIHLATALSVGPDAMVVYDRQLAREAERAGLAVLSPGA